MKDKVQKIIGKCLCEAIEYEVAGSLGPIFNCHCSKCRRWHGAAFRTRASINRSQLIWLSGKDKINSYKSSERVTKHFCRICGSPLHSTYTDMPNILGIPIGALDGLTDAKPEAHIFVGSKAEWFEVTDTLPQYEKWPENEARVRKTSP